MAAQFRIVSWNIQAIRNGPVSKLAAVARALAAHSPQVVVLQEVSARGSVATDLQRELAAVGLVHFCFSGDPNSEEKKYGNVIASRWPLERRAWPVPTPWPQLMLAARVDYGRGPFLVVGVHIPNGSNNGWRKIDAFEALAAGLAHHDVRGPTVLAGDFNEPEAFKPKFLSWGASENGSLEGDWQRKGESFPRTRWQSAVAAVLAPRRERSARGAWDVEHTVLQAGARFEATHIAGETTERCYDHILTTTNLFVVREVGYDHSVRQGENAVSDHSIVLATLSPGGEQFDDDLLP